MSDIAFQIQLGLILPKLRSTVKDQMLSISEELGTIVQAGNVEGGDVDLAAVKEVLMKSIETFVDQDIVPALDAKLNPPADEPVAEASEEAAEEEPAEEEA
ncbi:hypothetical protein [Vibrio marisflavi]|uniref:Uncharacterized protein n=1 Tax=Vibrio marisflavi CECT 7928 TaxID=634439 RepID=A0ABM8ZZT4_9VIBR|nr:hypothetical protein [Vibrio marisflavi]CAH0536062.1 hypothetical protein VMF7928_00158 [Vibrio marisflavi CECT 7928]